MSRNTSDTQNMALFCDFENVALGVKEARFEQFDIGKILERLLLKGSIVVKKAYCDWDRYRDFKVSMHQASFEMIEIPHVRMSGKNSADIRMVVDALDLCYTKAHVDTFVVISGDSDFSPLVSKLRENNKTVIGVGVKNSTSDLLIANCDEFIFYDDLVREQRGRTAVVAKARASARARAERPERTPKAAGATGRERQVAVAENGVVGEQRTGGEAGPQTRNGARLKTGTKAKTGRRSSSSAERSPAESSPFESSPFEGSPFEGLPVEGSPFESSPFESSPAESSPAESAPADGAPADGAPADGVPAEGLPAEREERTLRGLELVVETLEALLAERGEDERIWGSMVKQTLKRRNPGFNELYYGHKSFNRMLEEARDRGMITLEDDDKSGGYIVRAAVG